MHRQSLHKLVGTHVLFFDTTPIGRILNRFSKVRLGRLTLICRLFTGAGSPWHSRCRPHSAMLPSQRADTL